MIICSDAVVTVDSFFFNGKWKWKMENCESKVILSLVYKKLEGMTRLT